MIYFISLDTQQHYDHVFLFHLPWLFLVHYGICSYLKNSIELGIYRNFHIFQEPFFSCSLALPLFYTVADQPLIFFSTLTKSSSTSLLVYSLTTSIYFFNLSLLWFTSTLISQCPTQLYQLLLILYFTWQLLIFYIPPCLEVPTYLLLKQEAFKNFQFSRIIQNIIK